MLNVLDLTNVPFVKTNLKEQEPNVNAQVDMKTMKMVSVVISSQLLKKES